MKREVRFTLQIEETLAHFSMETLTVLASVSY